MSNSNLQNKIDNLEKMLAAERTSADKGFKLTIAVYGILVLIVIFYTGYIVKEFKEKATPQTIASMMSGYAEEQLPVMKGYLKENVKEQAPVWAEKAVDYSISIIPQLEDVGKKQVDVLVDNMVAQFNQEHFPKLQEFCFQNLDKTFKDADIISDEKMSGAIADVLVERIDDHINQVVNDKFYYKLNELRAEVDKVLAKPDNKLTKKERAEKDVLIYWTFLVNHAEVGNSRFMDAVKFFSMFVRAFDDMHLNLEKTNNSL